LISSGSWLLTNTSRFLARSVRIDLTRWADSTSRKALGSSSTSTGRFSWVLELIEFLKQTPNPEAFPTGSFSMLTSWDQVLGNCWQNDVLV
jgi:hypothetical protein